MVKNKNKNQDEGLQEVEQALTKTEQFLENNLNTLIYVVAAAIIIVVGYLGLKKFYIAPKNQEAQEQMFGAQAYFKKDSFNLAVNGDGVSLGFLDVIEDYGSTPAGNLAKYYAGLSYLHMGQYEDAIDYLKGFKTDDIVLGPLSKSAIGDAYVELEEYDKAVSAYKKGLSQDDNEFTTPTIKLKLGLVYETKGDTQKALDVYNEIKEDYPGASDITTVDKYIARLNQ